MNYYNEFDPKSAAWLRQLIKDELIPDGTVDERSIADVRPEDLQVFTQCHFFAGIGGWPYALAIAGWPADRPVWTGSCPCQPFSAAGKQRGTEDERHLWPAFFRLIRECRPDAVFGEQVANAIGHGWLGGIQTDLEGEGYAVGHCVLGAHSVGAPHIRQRLYWMAHAGFITPRGVDTGGGAGSCDAASEWRREEIGQSGRHCATGRLADASEQRRREAWQSSTRPEEWIGSRGATGGMGDAINSGLEGHGGTRPEHDAQGREAQERHSSPSGFWSDFDTLPCLDGKTRRVESGTFPLAHGVPARVVRLRGYGNAIVPQVAAEFIQAFVEVKGGQ